MVWSTNIQRNTCWLGFALFHLPGVKHIILTKTIFGDFVSGFTGFLNAVPSTKYFIWTLEQLLDPMHAIVHTKYFYFSLWQIFHCFMLLYGFCIYYCIFALTLKDVNCPEVSASIWCTSNLSIWGRSIFNII